VRVSRTRRRWWLWGIGGLAVALIAVAAIVAVPILTHRDQGAPNQAPQTDEWPLSAEATGDDGRDRSIHVTDDQGGEPDTSALVAGDRLIVSGAGFDPERGIYVAICAIPDDPAVKPGPCLGGVPSGDEPGDENAQQYAPSNWINDDWAWKLFGARGYDDPAAGTFTAYLEVPEPADENVDCTVVACAVYTRNDHTAANDRVQDLYIPVGFAS
jgi:hypothetical protein